MRSHNASRVRRGFRRRILHVSKFGWVWLRRLHVMLYIEKDKSLDISIYPTNL